jgi:hypothetical protein
MSGRMASLLHPHHERLGAVDRRAFLVAGDDEAERSAMIRDIGAGGDESGNGALHVDRSAPVEQAAPDCRLERVAGPAVSGGTTSTCPAKAK